MVEKNDLPIRLIEKTLGSFMKDSQTLEDLKLSIDLESNLKTFSINSIAKHLDYLSVFKLIVDKKTVLNLDESFSSNMLMIKRYQD